MTFHREKLAFSHSLVPLFKNHPISGAMVRMILPFAILFTHLSTEARPYVPTRPLPRKINSTVPIRTFKAKTYPSVRLIRKTNPTVAMVKRQPIPVWILSRQGGTLQKTTLGLQIGPRSVLVRLDHKIKLYDLIQDGRATVGGMTSLPLQLTDIDLNSQWVHLAADREIPRAAIKVISTAQYQSYFGGFATLSPVIATFQERQPASVGRPELQTVQERMMQFSQQVSQQFENATRNVDIAGAERATSSMGMKCQVQSPHIGEPVLQGQVTSASSWACLTGNKLELGEETLQSLRVEFGFLTAPTLATNSSDWRQKLNPSLLGQAKTQMESQSASVRYSTAVDCQSHLISDIQIESNSCIRGFKLLPDLTQTLAVFGKWQGSRYLYAQIQTTGFSAEATDRVVRSTLQMLERSK